MLHRCLPLLLAACMKSKRQDGNNSSNYNDNNPLIINLSSVEKSSSNLLRERQLSPQFLSNNGRPHSVASSISSKASVLEIEPYSMEESMSSPRSNISGSKALSGSDRFLLTNHATTTPAVSLAEKDKRHNKHKKHCCCFCCNCCPKRTPFCLCLSFIIILIVLIGTGAMAYFFWPRIPKELTIVSSTPGVPHVFKTAPDQVQMNWILRCEVYSDNYVPIPIKSMQAELFLYKTNTNIGFGVLHDFYLKPNQLNEFYLPFSIFFTKAIAAASPETLSKCLYQSNVLFDIKLTLSFSSVRFIPSFQVQIAKELPCYSPELSKALIDAGIN